VECSKVNSDFAVFMWFVPNYSQLQFCCSQVKWNKCMALFHPMRNFNGRL